MGFEILKHLEWINKCMRQHALGKDPAHVFHFETSTCSPRWGKLEVEGQHNVTSIYVILHRVAGWLKCIFLSSSYVSTHVLNEFLNTQKLRHFK